MQTIAFRGLTAEVAAGEYVVTVTGEIDLHTAPRLQEILDRLIDDGARAVVLDLRALDFMDSAGLGVVTRAAKRIGARGGELVLASQSHEVLAVFRVTGLDRFLTIRSTLSDALETVRERAA